MASPNHVPQTYTDLVTMIKGREEIFAYYQKYPEWIVGDHVITRTSVANTLANTNWPELKAVLPAINAGLESHPSTVLMPPGYLEALTENGTKHEEWARGMCAKKNARVYFLDALDPLFSLMPNWELRMFPKRGTITIVNCAEEIGFVVRAPYLTPWIESFVRDKIAHATPTTYKELFERCFKKPLTA